MYILVSPEGNAYHTSDGMPSIRPEIEDFGVVVTGDFLPLVSVADRDHCFLELSADEAQQLQQQARMALYGRRYGLEQ